MQRLIWAPLLVCNVQATLSDAQLSAYSVTVSKNSRVGLNVRLGMLHPAHIGQQLYGALIHFVSSA